MGFEIPFNPNHSWVCDSARKGSKFRLSPAVLPLGQALPGLLKSLGQRGAVLVAVWAGEQLRAPPAVPSPGSQLLLGLNLRLEGAEGFERVQIHPDS